MTTQLYAFALLSIVILALLPKSHSPLIARSVIAALSGTYCAWTVFFICTNETLAVLVPVVALLMPSVVKNGIFNFLQWPLVISFALVAGLALTIRLTLLQVPRSFVWTVTVATALNCAFISSVIIFASLVAEETISLAAARLNPVCFQRNSFVQSLLHSGNSGHAHAIVRLQSGEQFYWSYSTQSFFMGHPALDRNFMCQNGIALQ